MPTVQLERTPINVPPAPHRAPTHTPPRPGGSAAPRAKASTRGVGARYAVPVSLGAAMVSVAAAGFAAGYELVSLGARHRPTR